MPAKLRIPIENRLTFKKNTVEFELIF